MRQDPKKKKKKKKTNAHDKASKLNNELLKTYFDKYYDLLDAIRSKMDLKNCPANLTLDRYDYSEW